jgi:hypothetical protein
VFENPKSAHNQGLAFDATTQDRDYEGARQRMRSYLNGLGFREGAMSGGSGDYSIEPGTRDHMHVQFNSHEASERYYAMIHAAKVARDGAGWADPLNHSSLWGKNDPINPTFIPSWNRGLFREGVFAPQKAPTIGRPPLPAGQQDVSLPPLHRGDLARLERRNRPEPGSLLRAADARQASISAKHTVEGEASLRIKLASGLVPDGGVKNKGTLFKEIRMDRAPLTLASTTG